MNVCVVKYIFHFTPLPLSLCTYARVCVNNYGCVLSEHEFQLLNKIACGCAAVEKAGKYLIKVIQYKCLKCQTPAGDVLMLPKL